MTRPTTNASRFWSAQPAERTACHSRTGERGSAAFELPLILGLILLPFGVLLLSVSTWVERQTAARDAAGEAARLVVIEGPDGVAAAEALVREIEAGYGLPVESMRLELASSSGLAQSAGPGDAVVAQVTVEMPGAVLPLFGSFGDITWTAEHVERFPDYGATQ